MSTYSQFFSTNPGNLVTDPQRMPWNVGIETTVGLGYPLLNGTTYELGHRPLSGADAWTILGTVADVSQVIADDTYATISNTASGSGILTNLILPGVTAGSDTVSVKVTVDGVAYTLTFTADNATDRFVSGLTMSRDPGGASAPEYTGMWQDADFVSGIAYRLNDSGNQLNYILPPNHQLSATPCVRFKSSLKVEMKSSDFTTTNNRDDCAVVYVLDQY